MKKQLFVSVDVRGDQELMDALERVKRRADADAAVAMLLDAARAIRDRARSLVRVRTGNLRKAIFASAGRPRRGDGKLSVIAGVSPRIAPHRHLVEYGHAGPHPAPPHPFWRPAVLAEWPTQRQMLIGRIRDLITKGR